MVEAENKKCSDKTPSSYPLKLNRISRTNTTTVTFDALYCIRSFQGALELGPLLFPNDGKTLTKRLLYCILRLARPVFFFFFSCLSTCGEKPRNKIRKHAKHSIYCVTMQYSEGTAIRLASSTWQRFAVLRLQK